MNYSLFFCEGLWDSFLLFRILSEDFGFNKMERSQISNVSFTKLTGDSKTFYCGYNDHVISIIQCGDKDEVIKGANFIYEKNIKENDLPLRSLSIFIDMDDMTADSMNQKINDTITFKSTRINIGELYDAPIKFGVWAFPDCQNSGAIERLLLNSYATKYGDLIGVATHYVQQTPPIYKVTTDGSEWNDRRTDKAVLCATSAVLQESGLVTRSIADDEWYSKPLPESLNNVVRFIGNLLNRQAN